MCIPWPKNRKATAARRLWPSRRYTPPIGIWDSTPEDRLSAVSLHRFLVGKFGKRAFSIELYDGVYTFTIPRSLTKTEQREISGLRKPVKPKSPKIPVLAQIRLDNIKKKGEGSANYPLLARNKPNWGKYNPFT